MFRSFCIFFRKSFSLFCLVCFLNIVSHLLSILLQYSPVDYWLPSCVRNFPNQRMFDRSMFSWLVLPLDNYIMRCWQLRFFALTLNNSVMISPILLFYLQLKILLSFSTFAFFCSCAIENPVYYSIFELFSSSIFELFNIGADFSRWVTPRIILRLYTGVTSYIDVGRME